MLMCMPKHTRTQHTRTAAPSCAHLVHAPAHPTHAHAHRHTCSHARTCKAHTCTHAHVLMCIHMHVHIQHTSVTVSSRAHPVHVPLHPTHAHAHSTHAHVHTHVCTHIAHTGICAHRAHMHSCTLAYPSTHTCTPHVRTRLCEHTSTHAFTGALVRRLQSQHSGAPWASCCSLFSVQVWRPQSVCTPGLGPSPATAHSTHSHHRGPLWACGTP